MERSGNWKGMFTLGVCVCVNVNVKRQEWVQTPDLCVCVCVSINAMLNFDGDVDANANVKCEHTLTKWLFVSQTSSPGMWYVVVRGGSRIPRRRGRQPSRKGRQPTILPKFPKNCMKLRKFWALGSARRERPP